MPPLFSIVRIGEPVADGDTADDPGGLETDQERGWDVMRRKIDAALALVEYFEIPAEGHSLLKSNEGNSVPLKGSADTPAGPQFRRRSSRAEPRAEAWLTEQ
jgi:hypothetical protein